MHVVLQLAAALDKWAALARGIPDHPPVGARPGSRHRAPEPVAWATRCLALSPVFVTVLLWVVLYEAVMAPVESGAWPGMIMDGMVSLMAFYCCFTRGFTVACGDTFVVRSTLDPSSAATSSAAPSASASASAAATGTRGSRSGSADAATLGERGGSASSTLASPAAGAATAKKAKPAGPGTPLLAAPQATATAGGSTAGHGHGVALSPSLTMRQRRSSQDDAGGPRRATHPVGGYDASRRVNAWTSQSDRGLHFLLGVVLVLSIGGASADLAILDWHDPNATHVYLATIAIADISENAFFVVGFAYVAITARALHMRARALLATIRDGESGGSAALAEYTRLVETVELTSRALGVAPAVLLVLTVVEIATFVSTVFREGRASKVPIMLSSYPVMTLSVINMLYWMGHLADVSEHISQAASVVFAKQAEAHDCATDAAAAALASSTSAEAASRESTRDDAAPHPGSGVPPAADGMWMRLSEVATRHPLALRSAGIAVSPEYAATVTFAIVALTLSIVGIDSPDL